MLAAITIKLGLNFPVYVPFRTIYMPHKKWSRDDEGGGGGDATVRPARVRWQMAKSRQHIKLFHFPAVSDVQTWNKMRRQWKLCVAFVISFSSFFFLSLDVGFLLLLLLLMLFNITWALRKTGKRERDCHRRWNDSSFFKHTHASVDKTSRWHSPYSFIWRTTTV